MKAESVGFSTTTFTKDKGCCCALTTFPTMVGVAEALLKTPKKRQVARRNVFIYVSFLWSLTVELTEKLMPRRGYSVSISYTQENVFCDMIIQKNKGRSIFSILRPCYSDVVNA